MTMIQDMLLMEPDLIHRFTRQEYYRMAKCGWFDDKRVELLEGIVLDMPRQDEPHVSVVSFLSRFLVTNLKNFRVRCLGPLSLNDNSEPEPDFAITPRPTKTMKHHPSTAIFVMEVSKATLARDRAKAAIYAAGVPEYWIVNLKARTIEQYTKPQIAPKPRYALKQVLKEKEAVRCTVLPLPPLAVKECLKWT